jgi:hypothetical protein
LGDTASFFRVVRIYAKKEEEAVTQKQEDEFGNTGPLRAGAKARRGMRQEAPGM